MAAQKSRSEALPARAASDEIGAWSRKLAAPHREICDALRKAIDAALPKASAKVWHGAPVWFVGENPVAGYSVKAKAVSLLFWNGLAFKDAALKPVGKFGAAEAVYRSADDIDGKALRGWLKQAGTKVFDSKGFFAERRARASRTARAS